MWDHREGFPASTWGSGDAMGECRREIDNAMKNTQNEYRLLVERLRSQCHVEDMENISLLCCESFLGLVRRGSVLYGQRSSRPH